MKQFLVTLGVLAGSALPGVAAELPEAFQGQWHASGACSPDNDTVGAFVTIGKDRLDGRGLQCTLIAIRPSDDKQNQSFAMTRACQGMGIRSVRMVLVESGVFGPALVTVDADGSFLTLYKRCP